MTDEMKPVRCGCGGEAQILHPLYTHRIIVRCGKCGITTPYMNSEAEAVLAWNRAMGITHERAVEYLQSTGWMEDHDYQMMEMGKEMARENFNE